MPEKNVELPRKDLWTRKRMAFTDSLPVFKLLVVCQWAGFFGIADKMMFPSEI